MRLAIVSDTHLPRGDRGIPAGCIERMRGADAILHAGDFIGADVLRALRELGPPVHAVVGNVDSAELRLELPATRVVKLGGVRIVLIHDAGTAVGRLKRLRRRFPDADAVVFGHSHMPLLEESDGFAIFNPGSPTDRRRAPHHTMGMATVEGGRVRFELIELD